MRGVINFGIDENGNFFYESISTRYSTEVEPTPIENAALQRIIEAIGDNAAQLHLYRRSENYLTICIGCEEWDFCRLKATERALWFSLDMDNSPFAGDPRLSFVKNKNQRHWKIQLANVDEIPLYADIISEAAERNLRHAEVQA